MPVIKPTVGRVVHFWPRSPELMEQPHAAIIAKVWSDNCVNLAAFDEHGNAYSVTNVHLHQEGAPRLAFDFAEWMPYQMGQAAKTEALEKTLQARGALGTPVSHEAMQRASRLVGALEGGGVMGQAGQAEVPKLAMSGGPLGVGTRYSNEADGSKDRG